MAAAKSPSKFGIELEFSRPLMNILYHERDKNHRWQKFSREINTLIKTGDISPGWQLNVDTSCGGEIVTPPFSDVANGFAEIAKVCEAANNMAKVAALPVADAECGLHIHFDAANIKPRHVGNIFALLHKYEPIIYSIYTNRNPRYCSPISVNMNVMPRARTWTQVRDSWYRPENNVKDPGHAYSVNFINSEDAGDKYDGTRYHGFNIHCYWRQRTIEFRYGRGTFDIDKIYSFYELCLAIVNKAIRMRTPEVVPNNNLKFSQLMRLVVDNYKFRTSFIRMCNDLKLSKITKITLWEMAKRNNASKITEKDPTKKKIFICDSNRGKFLISTFDGVFDLDGNMHKNAKIATSTKNLISAKIKKHMDGEDVKIELIMPENVFVETNIIVPQFLIDKYKKAPVREGDDWVEFIQ